MKSIGARLTGWYAATATLMLAAMFVAGHPFIRNHLVAGLDLLNESEFVQLKARLGDAPQTLTPAAIERRIRETSDLSTALFYIEVHQPRKGTVFRSANLTGKEIPDVKGGGHRFSAPIEAVGLVRVGEFFLEPYDILIATPMAQVEEMMKTYVEVCAGLLLLMLLLSLAIGVGLARMLLKPLRLIHATAQRISKDRLNERIPIGPGNDEITALARLLNQIFDHLESAFSQVQRFTADASHELRTPLSLVRLHAEKMLLSEALSPEHRESVLIQIDELGRLNQLVEDLLFLSRADTNAVRINRVAIRVTDFLNNFAMDAQVLAEDKGLRFLCTQEGDGEVRIDTIRIRQVLFNLLSNSIHVSPPGGTIHLRSVLTSHVWQVCVEDEGPGLSAEKRTLMFERFVRFHRGDHDDKGNGLGLAICLGIVVLHGGEIFALQGSGGRGLNITFEIPVGEAA